MLAHHQAWQVCVSCLHAHCSQSREGGVVEAGSGGNMALRSAFYALRNNYVFVYALMMGK